jgi:hypothetical protein
MDALKKEVFHSFAEPKQFETICYGSMVVNFLVLVAQSARWHYLNAKPF